MRAFFRRYRGKRVYCDAGIALRVCEDFTDRYDNIAISGLNYTMFVPDNERHKPVQINCHVYSCMCIRNDLAMSWRGRYNEDTDLCLQALATGWCTALVCAFAVEKRATMQMKGGNSDTLYQGDGRLKMARALERMWPGVVTVDRRFNRPQHVVNWKKFDTPLRLKPGVNLAALSAQGPQEYGMTLAQVAPEVRSPRLRGLLDDWRATHGAADDNTKGITP